MSAIKVDVQGGLSADTMRIRHDEFAASIASRLWSAPGATGVRRITDPSLGDMPVVQVLFVFERDLRSLHEVIATTWKLKSAPRVLVAAGDQLGIRQWAESLGMEIVENQGTPLSAIDYVLESDLYATPLRAIIRLVNAFEEVWEYVKAENLTASSDDLLHEINRLAERTDMEPRRLFKQIQKNDQLSALDEDIRAGKALDFIVANAKVAE